MNKQLILNTAAVIGIMNRGEAAVRCIRAVREYNELHGTTFSTVAFYIDTEKDALFVKEADHRCALSSLKGWPENRGTAYVNRPLMMEALTSTGCTAVWVGWGFLSEDAPFVEMIEQAGLVFLGPSSAAMALLGDKISAKDLAERSDVPILAWSKGPVRSLEEARRIIDERIGYPCIVKASNAGGGRGIRFVRTPEELEAQYLSAREETVRITGGDVVFIEQLVEKGRHLEVQVLADRHGNVKTFGVRDCSVQRRNQKIIEETPPPCFPPETIRAMEEAATRLIRAAGYESAGTVEYLYDLIRNQFVFMEVNTRLQVEHPITEQLCGIDLVKGQLAVASGKSIEDWNTTPRGVAMEVRLNAEDPDREFTPAPGKVSRWRIPAGPGIRVDSGIEQGSEIPQEFDSMVAKVIAYAPTRGEAMARLRRALCELRVMIEGGTTNRAFLLELLACPQIQAGGVHTRFVEELLRDRRSSGARTEWPAALVAVAVTRYREQERDEREHFGRQFASNGTPRDIMPSNGLEVNLKANGTAVTFVVKSVGNDTYHLRTGSSIFPVRFSEREGDQTLVLSGVSYHIQIVERGDALQVEVNGIPHAIERESGGYVKAPSPALVLSVRVQKGQAVKKGDVLLTLEAMKMEMLVTAAADGTVGEILVSVRDQVVSGQPLLQIESGEEKKTAAPRSGASIAFAPGDAAPAEAFRLLKEEYLASFLGYDHDTDVETILERLHAFVVQNPEYRRDLEESFFSAFEMYASIEQLFSGKEMMVEGFARPATCQELLVHFMRIAGDRGKGLPKDFMDMLERAFSWFPGKKTGTDNESFYLKAFYRIYKSHADIDTKQSLLLSSLLECEQLPVPESERSRLARDLDEIAYLTQTDRPSLADAAIHARYQLIDRALLEGVKDRKRAKADRIISLLGRTENGGPIHAELLANIVDAGNYITTDLVTIAASGAPIRSDLALEVLGRRFTRDRSYVGGKMLRIGAFSCSEIVSEQGGTEFRTFTAVVSPERYREAVQEISRFPADSPDKNPEVIILVTPESPTLDSQSLMEPLRMVSPGVIQLTAGVAGAGGTFTWYQYTRGKDGWEENPVHRPFSPIQYRELRVPRLRNFTTRLQYAGESVFLLSAVAKENPRDERLFALVEVPSTHPEFDENNRILRMVALENVFMEVIYAMRAEQARRKHRLYWNRIIIHFRSLLGTTLEQTREYAGRLAARTADLGIEKFIIFSRRLSSDGIRSEELELLFENISGNSFTLRGRTPSAAPLVPMDGYVGKVVRARQRGTTYPYEIVKMITRSGFPVSEIFPRGEFEEFDLRDCPEEGAPAFVSVKGRPHGRNTGNIVFGIMTNYLHSHPQGVRRVIILSDSTVDLGSLAEPECRRINAALDLAELQQMPVEWIPISAGARIDMSSGTENLDWTAATLRRIIEFTQNGGEINIIVSGINVGAQSYWNAEATMLMHTRGLLIMTEEASMLLTGKKALDFSGSVSAEKNVNIGGAERIMGPNGQAQVKVRTLYEAYSVLFRHYSLTWVEPGTIFPGRQKTTDPADRNVCLTPYTDQFGQGFTKIGDIFSRELNGEKKKPFDMRQVMSSVIDTDAAHLERWLSMKDGETAIVWETRIGGYPIGLIGIESRPISRIGDIPHDGPESWNGGTLFPLSSKKVARGINAFSGKLPLVILANLSGFDGSPESLRKLQLEYGAEIGRAIVNFRGPIIFVVTARYHGGAYVVFSKSLNPHFHSVALEGSFASVIGGAPAAAVVFPGQVNKETNADPRVVEALSRLREFRSYTQQEYDEVYRRVHKEKETALAARFDSTHSVERAKSVGSIDEIISPAAMRPYIIDRIEKGIACYLEKVGSQTVPSARR